MKYSRLKKPALLLISVSTSTVALATYGSTHGAAAETTERNFAQIDEIVVTAQKRAQRLQDIGLSIDVLSGDDILAQGVRSVSDLGKVSPGLIVNESAAQGAPIFTVRGVGFFNIYANASSTVGLYSDEVAIPYSIMARGTLFDIERVEVLKGPQGDLYGRNATAGQINFITGRPSDTFGGGVFLEYGRFNSLKAEGFVTGPVADNVQFRIAVNQLLNGGWQRSISRPNDELLGDKDQTSIRGKLNFDISENSSFLVSAYWTRDQSENLAATPFDGREIGMPNAQNAGTRLPVVYSSGDNRAADWDAGFRPQNDDKGAGFSGHLNLDLGSVAFTSITAYDRFNQNGLFDWDGSDINEARTLNRGKIRSLTQEIRFASVDNENLNWIVGGYFSRDTLDMDYERWMADSATFVRTGVAALHTIYDQKTTSLAGFAHAEYKVTSELELVGGIRFTNEKRTFNGCTYDQDGTLAASWNNAIIPRFIIPRGLPNPGVAEVGGCGVYNDLPGTPGYGTLMPIDAEATTNKWMGKVGINYKPTDDYLIYASVSTGFKSGGFNGASVNVHSQWEPYLPERLNAYEIGTKLRFDSLALDLEAAAFYYDYKNKQESSIAVTFVGNIPAITNIPKSRILGAEFGGNWRPTKEFSVGFDITYLDTKVLRWEQVSQASSYPVVVMRDSSGGSLPNAAKWSINVNPSYRFDVSGDLYIDVGGNINYRSRTSGVAGNYQILNGRTLVDLRLALGNHDESWQVTLWGENVFNKYYWQYANIGGTGPYVRVNGMPATYGIRLSSKF